MTHASAAHRATWTLIQNAALDVAGFASPLHAAALAALLGPDPKGERFAALAARLSTEDQDRLWARVETLETERAQERRDT